MKYAWLLFFALGLICNVLGIFLHGQEMEGPAATLMVLGIINFAVAFGLHWQKLKHKPKDP